MCKCHNNNVEVKIKTSMKLPVYSTVGASCMDIYVSESGIIEPGEIKAIPTGLFVEIPEGYEIQIRPRSGLSLNGQLLIMNTPGTIDSDYRGEIKVIIKNMNENPFKYTQNETRIAQMAILPVYKIKWIETNILNNTERSVGGFGHTGGM